MEKTEKGKYILLITLYIFINTLFIYKYGQRQDIIPLTIVFVIYAFLVSSAIVTFYLKVGVKIHKKWLSYLYWFIVGVFSLTFSFIVYKIDGESLNVDRWSALELTIQGITEGIYPYSRIDYLGNMSSNFPALGFLGLPFYLLGDVGYLQVFTYILFSIYVYKTPILTKTSFLILFLFLISPAMIWEIFAKSDLVSNLMLVILFIEYWSKKYNKSNFEHPIILGSIISFFCLTRGVVLVPLALFFLKKFWFCDTTTKIKLTASILVTSIIICLPTIASAPEYQTIIDYNPIILQTNKSPVISYVILCAVFILPWYLKNHNDYLYYSTLILFTIPFISMIYKIQQLGWDTTIFESQFDISYLSMSIPPILIWLMNKSNVDFKQNNLE